MSWYGRTCRPTLGTEGFGQNLPKTLVRCISNKSNHSSKTFEQVGLHHTAHRGESMILVSFTMF